MHEIELKLCYDCKFKKKILSDISRRKLQSRQKKLNVSTSIFFPLNWKVEFRLKKRHAQFLLNQLFVFMNSSWSLKLSDCCYNIARQKNALTSKKKKIRYTCKYVVLTNLCQRVTCGSMAVAITLSTFPAK